MQHKMYKNLTQFYLKPKAFCIRKQIKPQESLYLCILAEQIILGCQ